MLLILSDENDPSTNDVIDWLLHCKIPYIRINDTSLIHVETFTINDGGIDFVLEIQQPHEISKVKIRKSEISSYWYRRGFFNLQWPSLSRNDDYEYIRNNLAQFIRAENLKLTDFFINIFYGLNI